VRPRHTDRGDARIAEEAWDIRNKRALRARDLIPFSDGGIQFLGCEHQSACGKLSQATLKVV
jgi:hypothetical protein